MEKHPTVYILTNKRHGTLYVGVSSNVVKRVWQHKEHLIQGFTKRYGLSTLVYIEQFEDMTGAISREKQLKKWNRAWKIELIESENPNWLDLYPNLL
ncbi:GIY-YIG nuclease family protein [Teredinibacter franksiae]|uniref:GIY-YIG nuclease family protein n=1 Tax=Teredinibacter franksiae TaxID=2761453 RepID=UPI0016295FB2|nr:GIY-YIG nuclease family protein [Teredinibacter franksiae]